MATYKITAPDGSSWSVTAPDGANEDAVMKYAKAMWKRAPSEPKADPTEGTSFGQRALEGVGKAFVDLGRGAGQRLGMVSQADIDEASRLDAPLMKTGGGITGNVLGNVAIAAPTAAIPGANTVLGAGAVGGVLGALNPTQTGESVGRNVLGGAVFSGAIPALVAGGKAVKAAIDPFHSAGQERIASDTIKRFATDPSKAAQTLRSPEQFVQGVRPTAAEASLDPGIAILQRSAMSADPQIAGQFATREAENAAARIAALRGIAGDEGQKAFYEASRKQAANELYAKAFSEVPTDKAVVGELKDLMKRPVFRSAVKRAQEMAKNEGVKLTADNQTKVAHYTKLALDDMIGEVQGNTQRVYMDARDKLLNVLESPGFSPSYGEARKTFAEMSKPINQMEVGQALYNRMQPALSDFAGDAAALPRIKSSSYAEALRNGDQTAARATGFRGAKMENVMSPEQMQTITGVAKDLSRRASAQEIGKVPGSPTAQYLSSQNLMRQVAGPLGMPQSFVESALMQTMARPLDFAAKRADPLIQQRIAQMMLDPEKAADALQKLAKKEPELFGLLGKYLPVTAGSGLLSYSGQ